MSKYIQPLNKLYFSNIDNKIFKSKYNFTEIIMELLTYNKNVFNIQIKGFRGTGKSILSQSIGLYMKKHIKNLLFDITHIAWNNQELYNMIKRYLDSINNQIENENVKKYSYYIRDENPSEHGIGSYTTFADFENLDESIRIGNINKSIITPFFSLHLLQQELQYEFSLIPFEFNYNEKYFLCLVQHFDSQDLAGHCYIPFIQNKIFYKKYLTIKHKKLQECINQQYEKINLYQYLYIIAKKYPIFEKKYTQKEFKMFVHLSNLNLGTGINSILCSLYNNMFILDFLLAEFKQYLNENNYEINLNILND